ncbi:fimbrial protein [Cronobacter turicensis]|uniref:F4 family fimbrial subunit n=1 Tax=Cronobacter turicensis TaxID=413502 RepID=UPI0024C2BD8D|nr:fimbrial protein [Cronobacter turicensis]MDK1186947.1 fimbrial protein [Cronobacter turicensis]MDK1207819.1 fimbrial protein [Cronobacter turicensis]MDK1216762.1 fimbrial protein [Cronobacter turicensis]MDK1220640.1 fimbrial protein [Cronobacter turicensis]MDK1233852.1 fimbrial protein [Cronobacter turicensis]
MVLRRIFILILSLQLSTIHAEILDGGEIRFNGFVTDEAPKWTWQIGSQEQNWAVDTADARIENKQLVFSLKDKGSLPFLEGHLYEVAERGGPGFTPFISFSSSGHPFTITEGGTSRSQNFRATVPVKDPENGKEVGQLAFSVNQALAVSVGDQNGEVILPTGMSFVSGESISKVQPGKLPREVVSRLSTLLLMNNNFGKGMSALSNGIVINQDVLANREVTNLAAAYTSELSDFELRLPAENTPARWEAGLNVTVTVH